MFYGRKLGMTKHEVMVTPMGEMLDMINCLSIYEGGARQKNRKKWSYDQVMAMR